MLFPLLRPFTDFMPNFNFLIVNSELFNHTKSDSFPILLPLIFDNSSEKTIMIIQGATLLTVFTVVRRREGRAVTRACVTQSWLLSDP